MDDSFENNNTEWQSGKENYFEISFQPFNIEAIDNKNVIGIII